MFLQIGVSYIDSSRGFITGLGAKMFVIAGPVLVYGTVASVIYGVIYYIIMLINVSFIK